MRVQVVIVLMLAAFVLFGGCASSADAQDRQTGVDAGGWRLLESVSFDDGDMVLELQGDASAWRVDMLDDGNGVLHLHRRASYQPPVRSPHSRALTPFVIAGDVRIEYDVRSTSRIYNHQDVCTFFGHADERHLHYVHIAPAPDPHAHSVFLVDDAPRVSIVDWRNGGFVWDDQWHHVRVEITQGLITVMINGDEIMRASASHVQAGSVGVGSFDDTAMFDNISVWTR